MASVRCEACGKPIAAKPPNYSETRYLPIGYPNRGLVCGTQGCENDGSVWLKDDEEKQYATGERIFGIFGGVKVRVQ